MKDLNKLHGRPPKRCVSAQVKSAGLSEDEFNEIMDKCDSDREVEAVLALSEDTGLDAIKLILQQVRDNPDRSVFVTIINESGERYDGLL